MELARTSALVVLLALALARGQTHADEVRIVRDGDTLAPPPAKQADLDGQGQGRQRQQQQQQPQQEQQAATWAPEDAPAEMARRADIVSRYFEFEGLSPDLDAGALAQYDADVVDKMAELLAKRDDFIGAFTLNSQINALIYERVSKRAAAAEQPPAELHVSDEALLQTLHLLVPDSLGQPDLALAKDDLRQFCLEQPARCRDLLARLRVRLERKTLHTMDAIAMLEGFYHNWTPLGRLSKYVEDYGQSDN